MRARWLFALASRCYVDNVTVVTQLDKQIARLEERREKVSEQEVKHGIALVDAAQELTDTQRRYDTIARYVDGRLESGQHITQKLRAAADQRRALTKETSQRATKVHRLEQKLQEDTAQSAGIDADLSRHRDKRSTLESRRTIFKHDVELDSLFGVLKV